MPTLPQIDPATATGERATVFADVEKTLGAVPNLTRVMANSPALLRGWLALRRELDGGVLPAAVRERLALATAEYNACEYCLSAHTYTGARVAKIDRAELDAARSATSRDPHIAALLALSDGVVRARGGVDEAALAQARAAGVSDAEIVELVGNVALNVLTNYLNNLAHTEVDFPPVAPRS
jgi:uncharacterized peroxidase-related enzyme